MESDRFHEEVLRRLDALIALHLQALPDEDALSMSAKIQRLRNLGMTPSTIAGVIGKPLNYVTATLSRSARSGGKTRA